MWLAGLAVVGALVAIDGIVLTIYPEQLRQIVERIFRDDPPAFARNPRWMRVVGMAETCLGVGLLVLANVLKGRA